MSSSVLIVSVNRDLLKQFHSTLSINSIIGLELTDGNLLIYSGNSRIYVDVWQLDFNDEVFKEEIPIYQKLLGLINGEVLYVYHFSYGDTNFCANVMSVITDRNDIVVDNDIGLILNGPEYFKLLEEYRINGNSSYNDIKIIQ